MSMNSNPSLGKSPKPTSVAEMYRHLSRANSNASVGRESLTKRQDSGSFFKNI